MSEWISVKDRLPERGSIVLVYDSQRGIMCISETRAKCFDVENPMDGLIVTHWMPLPQPPESEDDEE